MRVALAYGMGPDQISATVRDRLDAYPDLPMRRETGSVAEKGYRGVAVGPIPGSTPSTEVYVPADGRVYLINVYGEELGETGKNSSRKSTSIHPRGRSSRSGCSTSTLWRPSARVSASSGGGGGEAKIAEGCWRADPDFFVQTQHGMYSNEGWYLTGATEHSGWSRVGKPNFWGEYTTHGSVGYGRCKRPMYTNDKFAVDYPLEKGDAVFSPFGCGRVTFAGRNVTHQDYGILVSIESCNGKYVSPSGHLSGIAEGINEGKQVDEESVIGYAGETGARTSPWIPPPSPGLLP